MQPKHSRIHKDQRYLYKIYLLLMNFRAQHILFISTMSSTPWGGSEELWTRAAVSLKKRGHNVSASIIKWKTEHQKIKDLKNHRIPVTSWAKSKSVIDQIITKLSISNFLNIDIRSLYLRRIKPDLVVISQGYILDGLEWATICKTLNIPYCIIVHANSEQWWPEDIQLDLIRKCYISSAKIFCVSKTNQELLEWQCGAHLPQSEVIRNPWSSDINEAIQWPKSNGLCRFACVARLDQRAKGQDLIIRLLAMEKWKRRPVHVNFFGQGPLSQSLVNLAAMQNVTRISFFGYVQSIANIWKDNEALLLPSRFEGLPIAIVEAMMAGRVVITTNIGGNAEYIIDNVNGFIANAPTLDSLDESLERAWQLRSSWENIGINAREHIVATITSDPVFTFCENLINLSILLKKVAAPKK
jgi:glycosyltransferase involved in cell wall biosynthesis